MQLREDRILKNANGNFPRYSTDAMKSPRKIEI